MSRHISSLLTVVSMHVGLTRCTSVLGSTHASDCENMSRFVSGDLVHMCPKHFFFWNFAFSFRNSYSVVGKKERRLFEDYVAQKINSHGKEEDIRSCHCLCFCKQKREMVWGQMNCTNSVRGVPSKFYK